MAMIREFNLVREDAKDSMHLVFEPEHRITFFPSEIQTMDILMTFIGAFPSRSQARKNGFFGPIPMGWSEKPKGSLRFWIWNPTKD